MDAPQQVVFIVIEPKTESGQEKLAQGLRKLMAEDPTFRIDSDVETGRTIVRGIDQLQLETIVDRLIDEFNVEATVGEPQAAYRETLTQMADGEGRYIKQTGGHGQYGHVKIRVEPLPAGSGFEFVNGVTAGRLPREYIDPTEAGIKEALENGILAGYPMSDVKVTLYDGSYHDVDSSETAFKIAGSMAIKETVRRAKPMLLEPIMAVEVVVPDEFNAAVMGDLTSRRGRIEGMDLRGATQIIKAFVPLSEMLGYASDLRLRTQGRATCSMHFDRYEPAPAGLLRMTRTASLLWLCYARQRRKAKIRAWRSQSRITGKPLSL
jgi:elongation factor G